MCTAKEIYNKIKFITGRSLQLVVVLETDTHLQNKACCFPPLMITRAILTRLITTTSTLMRSACYWVKSKINCIPFIALFPRVSAKVVVGLMMINVLNSRKQ